MQSITGASLRTFYYMAEIIWVTDIELQSVLKKDPREGFKPVIISSKSYVVTKNKRNI